MTPSDCRAHTRDTRQTRDRLRDTHCTGIIRLLVVLLQVLVVVFGFSASDGRWPRSIGVHGTPRGIHADAALRIGMGGYFILRNEYD